MDGMTEWIGGVLESEDAQVQKGIRPLQKSCTFISDSSSEDSTVGEGVGVVGEGVGVDVVFGVIGAGVGVDVVLEDVGEGVGVDVVFEVVGEGVGLKW